MYVSPSFSVAEQRIFLWDYARVLAGVEQRRRQGGADAARQILSREDVVIFDASGLPMNVNPDVRETLLRHEAVITDYREVVDLIDLT
jgi:hypothetical protein